MSKWKQVAPMNGIQQVPKISDKPMQQEAHCSDAMEFLERADTDKVSVGRTELVLEAALIKSQMESEIKTSRTSVR